MVGFLIATPKPEFEDHPLPVDLDQVDLSEYALCHGSAEVPTELIQALICRGQQIGQIEILGALVAYLSAPGLLAGREIIHWIDNTSALSALTKGYSGVPDSARLVHLFSMRGTQGQGRRSGSSTSQRTRTQQTSHRARIYRFARGKSSLGSSHRLSTYASPR